MVALPDICAGHLTFSNVPEGAEALLLAELSKTHHKPIIHVTRDAEHMEMVAQSVQFFAHKCEVLTFPAWDCLPYDRVSPNSTVTSKRIDTLSHLLTQKEYGQTIIVTTVNAVLQKILAREQLTEAVFYVEAGSSLARDALSHFLSENGYIHVSKVTEPGEFALRGSIVDLFPAGEERGLRLDFFGDTVETIRYFDPLTQVSETTIQQVRLVPAGEILLNEDSIMRFRSQYREHFGAMTKQDPLYEAVSAGRKYAGIEHWMPLFYDKMETLLDYVPGALVTCSHLSKEAMKERVIQVQDYYEARTEQPAAGKTLLSEATYHAIPPSLLYLTENDWQQDIAQKPCIHFSPFSLPEESDDCYDMEIKPSRRVVEETKRLQKSAFDIVKEIINTKMVNQYVMIACMSEGSRERLQRMLQEQEIHTVLLEKEEMSASSTGKYRDAVALVILPTEYGFETDSTILITEQDLFGEKMQQQRRKKTASEHLMTEVSHLQAGELVVHREHGIAKFDGLETITVSGNAHDCLRLIYAGGDRCFVPVENSDLVTRYGNDNDVPLDRLGSVAWQGRKSGLKKRIKMEAEMLLKIAAERQTKRAAIFTPPSGLYEEFCARFPYVETEDQLRTMEDVLGDLALGKPMDRLVCGDVGFGKTEIALRTAFLIAMQQSKEERGQVAIITPTTLLCRQHMRTFTERFSGLPVTIRQLSRMVPAKEMKETKEMLKAGEVDIVVATHALLAEDIAFEKLALLIIDEEHHFGVKQKEKLKQLRANTHVLTLTATPIPRTLQMSLTGIKELSLIATPPVDRLAVRSYVMPYDPVVIREAMLREYYRGGRVFYVCPRIKDLEEVQKKLAALVPELKVVQAHGKMSPAELDEVMNAFYDGHYDVLLSTTIIESGIDVPVANTLIVHRADMYGLSQLYQIRGRVGRSKIRAYAYFTLPPKRIPTQDAVKRLQVMQTLDTLGAGFSIASYDMDIRGFGNLLGEEQSGHIKEVGIELYQQMLEEAVASIKEEGEEAVSSGLSPQINIGMSVLIPETYVTDLSLRLGLYKRIAALETSEQTEAMAAEMIDRFGTLPEEVDNLFAVMKIKQLCRELNIAKLDAGPKGAVIHFYHDRFANPEGLLTLATQHPDSIKLRPDQTLAFVEKEWHDMDVRLKEIQDSLRQIETLAA